jgi:O-antigen/teichoic acid export membrane protein
MLMASESISAKAVKGSFFSIGSSAITIVSGFVRSILLARLLAPEDFGVVALGTFFISIMSQTVSVGLTQALIHRSHDVQKAVSTYFVLRIGLALLVVLMVLLLVPLVERFYPSQPQLAVVLVALSCVELAKSLSSAPYVLLRKELEFKLLAIIDVTSSLAMTIGTPIMAWAGLGFWVLVGEQAISVVVRGISVWGVRRSWQPSLRFDRELAHWYVNFGASVSLSSGLNLLLDRFDDFWAGTAFGALALGFYSRAYEFARYPRRIVGGPITAVFFPAYAKLQHDRLRLSKAFYRASSLIVRLGFLFSMVFALVVPEFVHIFIGDKWLPMVFPFRLMLVYTLLDPLIATSGHLVTAVGQPQILTKIKVFQLLTFVPAVIVLANYFGINGIALAADLMLVTGVTLMLPQVRRLVDFSLWKLFCYPTIGLFLGAGISLLVRLSLPIASDWASLLVKGGTAAIVYIFILFLFEYQQYRKMFEAICTLLQQ